MTVPGIAHFAYLGVLLFCVLGTAWLELFLGTRVYARPRRLLLSLLPTVAVFVIWDVYAIDRGHWEFDARFVTGVVLPGGVPLEELLFFLVVPTCAILTLEAVRSRRPGWVFGDEAPAEAQPAPQPASDPTDRAADGDPG